MRLIDADRLLDRCKFYHLPNGDLAVPIIDVQHAPTVEAISRQQAIEAFETAAKGGASIEDIILILENLPSAQPEPRTAYWTKDIVGSVICSNCGGIREDNRIGHTQWCNCCGCFMRGEQE